MSTRNGKPHDLIGIGTSAGGVEALLRLLPQLPRDLSAAIGVVIHRQPTAGSGLLGLLRMRCAMRVIESTSSGLPFEPGTIYLAPADHHMTVVGDVVVLDRGPKQHHTRPAIDPLFRSLAVHGPRAVGVILTGTRSDGVGGLVAIKAAGGISIAQDPAEALFPSMPQHALVEDHVDRVLKLDEIATVLTSLARGEPLPSGGMPAR